VLLLLVERRGQLVLPQEIAERIWGKDVVLDIDNALNTAIRKVRRALRDDPAYARYVETVPAKGYRFIGANRGERGEYEWMFVTHEHNVTCHQAISEVPCLLFIAWSPFMISEDCPPSRRAPCPDHV
jgi:DNA-binding winged helix-turn-helix (wHTH) protein